jgi:hypothetical protein
MDTLHNPDRFMSDLRQILSQGRKRIGLLVGAGTPLSIKVDENGKLSDVGKPIISVCRRGHRYRRQEDGQVSSLSFDLEHLRRTDIAYRTLFRHALILFRALAGWQHSVGVR